MRLRLGFRAALAFGVVTLASLPLFATPIVVMKVKDGYIVATNGRSTEESRLCKLQYNSKQVTLHGAKIARYFSNDNRIIFDMNAVMWKVYADHPDSVTRSALGRALDAGIASISYELRQFKQIQFRLVNVNVEDSPQTPAGVYPDIVHIPLWNPLGWLWVSDWPFHKPFALKEGEALAWAATGEPIRVYGDPSLSGVRKLLDGAIPPGQERDFGPPYLIGQLDADGFRFLQDDDKICTAEHPAPTRREASH